MQSVSLEKLKESKITTKTILLGILLITPNVYWLVQLEMVWGGTYPSTITLLMPAVFSLGLRWEGGRMRFGSKVDISQAKSLLEILLDFKLKNLLYV